MDYTRFLQQKESEVLPYLGGASVDSPSRRLRITRAIEPGWWQFSIKGKNADPRHPAEPPDLSSLKKAKGHYFSGWLFISGNKVERLHLLPEEELIQFSICNARKWHNGSMLFETVDFESEAEDRVRLAFERKRTIADIKNVPATLRAAFGFAILQDAANRRNIPISPLEVIFELAEVAMHVAGAADTILSNIELRRRQRRLQLTSRRPGNNQTHCGNNHLPRRRSSVSERASIALDNAGADLSSLRMLSDNEIEVAYYFMGERFVSIANADTLQILDSGICLQGEDNRLTLESLPGVIREAINTGQLYITRH